MNITFYGGVGEVTGSKHLVEIGGMKILLDCGFHQGHRKEARELNSRLPFDPASIDAVVLSHAHLDHCGMLPLLIKGGYKGKIYSTPATKDVTEWILKDAAHIQMQDAAHLARHGSQGAHLAEPLYTIDDIPRVIERFEGVPYVRDTGVWYQLGKNVKLKFYDAGHILGSAVIVLEASRSIRHSEPFGPAQDKLYEESPTNVGDRSGVRQRSFGYAQDDNRIERLVFTGDLGRDGAPLIPDPEYVHEEAEVLLIESTYGGRVHQDFAAAKERLKTLVRETIQKRGKLIIPAFALGRTQELVYLLHQLTDAGEIPRIPTFVDSPLAGHVTDVFRAHTDNFDQETWKEFGKKDDAPLAFRNLTYTESVEESRRLNTMPGPLIIIASSGMCEGGRILHHLRNNIENPHAILLFTGFQAANTLGRRIIEGEKRVRVYDEFFEMKARVEKLNELSAHADRNELLKYAEHIKGLRHVFLVHGEKAQAAGFKSLLEEKHSEWQVSIPERGQVFEGK